ncbi:SIP domain-containing protein [Allonocardiopsis opalescens]|uniref:SIP domain-containing protein n=1 Tax=Allonocardiopsis opalescens TaxID=1144618 RepID=UPI001FE72954|nr:SIP domain-containing protein [Allonocardiopsis opalescens]
MPVRLIRVVGTERITPHLARVTFSGDGLAGVTPLDPDQEVKLYFPRPGQAEPRLPEPSGDFTRWYQAFTAIPEDERPWMRSYTLRSTDPVRGEAVIDFVLHPDAGPATRWALAARPGDTLGMFGPSPYFARPVRLLASVRAADWLLIAGDETALPAIAAILEQRDPATPALAFIEVAGPEDELPPAAKGTAEVRWLHRGSVPPGRADLLPEAVRAAEFPPGRPFAWLAGEAGTVRTLRRHLIGERGLDRASIEFTGHWRLRLSQDDAPTEDDLAEARERVAAAEAAASAPPAPRAGLPELSRDMFDNAYRAHAAPWVTGAPQPAVVALERAGLISGSVLDPGCGTGENTVHLARLGYDVLGLDFSEVGIEQARAKAAEQGVAARFEVGDALDLGGETRFDTVVDSALFHVFDAEHQAAYLRSLHRACRPGAVVHVLALSDEGPGYGPVIGEDAIRTAFTEEAGWRLEELGRTTYQGVLGPDGGLGELPAWLARARRI